MQDDEIPGYRLNAQNQTTDQKREEIPFSMGSSFKELLKGQLGLRKLSEEQELLAEYILGNIDEDGYLRRELESIADDLAFSIGLDTTYEALHEVLMIIQDFDPPGLGARNLQECLLLQINRKDLSDPVDAPGPENPQEPISTSSPTSIMKRSPSVLESKKKRSKRHWRRS